MPTNCRSGEYVGDTDAICREQAVVSASKVCVRLWRDSRCPVQRGLPPIPSGPGDVDLTAKSPAFASDAEGKFGVQQRTQYDMAHALGNKATTIVVLNKQPAPQEMPECKTGDAY